MTKDLWPQITKKGTVIWLYSSKLILLNDRIDYNRSLRIKLYLVQHLPREERLSKIQTSSHLGTVSSLHHLTLNSTIHFSRVEPLKFRKV